MVQNLKKNPSSDRKNCQFSPSKRTTRTETQKYFGVSDEDVPPPDAGAEQGILGEKHILRILIRRLEAIVQEVFK